jgi:predicted dehydrogenase
MNRRSFLQTTAVAPFFVRNLISAPPSGKVRLAAFGASNMAYVTLQQIARNPNVTLVAAAEVDSSRLDQLKRNFPDTKVYQDWREMLKKEKKNLDMACVGTPDHMHAPCAMSAMRQGLHVYVQKPLARDIYEIRRLTEYARSKKLVTQMGIQVHSSREYQTAVKLVHDGAIGKVKEVHTWSNKKWGDMSPMPDRTDPVPPTLDWDGWLGVAAKRPYIGDKYYHTENWRKRIDFGTATFGDMGCHIYDPVFGALKLTSPLSVRSEGPAPTEHNWAINSIIHYVFPGTDVTEGKTVAVTWYDGDEKPPQDIQKLIAPKQLPQQGSILIGTKGVMLLPHTAMPVLLPEADYRDYKVPQIEPINHYFQFVDTVRGNAKTTCSFDYSGPLTEAVLLGPLATRFPKTTLEWNSAKMKFTNSPEATRHVRRQYRAGWHVKGLS